MTRYLNLTLDLYKTLQSSLQPRLHLELGLIKLVHAGRLQSIESALAGLEKPPALSASARASAPRPPAFQAPPQATPKPIVETPAPLTAEEPVALTGDLRQDLHAALAKEGLNFSADAVLQADVSLQGTEVLIRAAKTLSFALKDPAIQRAAARVVGKPVRIKFEVGESSKAAEPTPTRPAGGDLELRARALSHPGVKRFQELFPDAQVRTVRNLNE